MTEAAKTVDVSFKPGDVVQLNSGGPKMTIRWVEPEYGTTYAYCEWFVQDKAPWKKDGEKYAVTSLRHIQP